MSVFSGTAAMIYQVAWAKMISLSFGNTTLAVGAVIASFMVLQRGFVEYFETKGPRVFQRACGQALRANPSDSMAASVQAKLPLGLQGILHPRKR